MTYSRKAAIFFVVLSAMTVLGVSFLSDRTYLSDLVGRTPLEQKIPEVFAGWRKIQVDQSYIISPEEQAAVNNLYSQVIDRVYENDQGQRVMLSVAYGKDQSNDLSQVHRPEICYTTQGFAIRDSHQATLDTPINQIDVTQLVAVHRNRIEPIIYWIVLADQVITPGVDRKLAQISYGFQRVIPDGLLFRVSTVGADSSQPFALQRSFIEDLLNAVDEKYLADLVGV